MTVSEFIKYKSKYFFLNSQKKIIIEKVYWNLIIFII